MITNGVGSVLRQIRKSRGESIVEVAKATHTSPASFTKWENDQTIPSERSIRKLAEYYDVDPLDLLGVAYPDKYAKQKEQEKAAAEGSTIRIEDLIGNNSVLTYNGSPLSSGTKSLVAAFITGLIISQPEE
ncbi:MULTISPECIES: helix-turn-helix domain-containing protein [Lacticaseibacillus]|nr:MULTISPECIES: helix-turn-helix transcriptional regulator [Lacticaseibacillus]OFR93782.1 transcriptional regulator [Lactobacillus sp. HMSC068F07]ARY92153.1 transcriptional regulator [Lacticaseibacillus casei]KAB1971203.1 helix-turn-helix transcriptional regulator [Lacticaseibacillus casei]KLI75944.1 XRE family transcriptional regulator [Lacticaseibacillus casei]MBI6597268.1 helix-turn-helix transcriptional regulator [Lacticaseibacillus casei]